MLASPKSSFFTDSHQWLDSLRRLRPFGLVIPYRICEYGFEPGLGMSGVTAKIGKNSLLAPIR